jgi:iron complex outermembrane receptor protein/outer membrane receptor for ferrienterochelin and colicins
MKKIIIILISVLSLFSGYSQENSFLKVTDQNSNSVIDAASVSIGNKSIAKTDEKGLVLLSLQGKVILIISSVGYESKTIEIEFPIKNVFEVQLASIDEGMEEVVIVASTRTNQQIENSTLKVEILGIEEMEEESTVKPASILGIIGDASGVQVQQSNAISVNSNVRIQGLDGKYTQILRDGLPLFEGYSGGFGMLSIPPLDLKQIELIKGSASTLYGGGAIGGLINLISKKPSVDQEGVITLNQTNLKETNINSYFSKKYKKIGYTIYAGYTKQNAVDVNGDEFSDLPENKSFSFHPRLFFYPNKSTTITLGYNAVRENRNGGDMKVIANQQDNIHQYFEKNTISRNAGEFLIEKEIKKGLNFNLKSSLSSFDRAITTPYHYFKANQLDYFSEASVVKYYKAGTWITGMNFSGNQFKKLPGDAVNLLDLKNNTLGGFTQFSHTFKYKTTVEVGLRNDHHNRYGNFFLPRLAFFYKATSNIGLRAGYGAGFKIPDALAPQITDYAIQNILPINTSVQPERSSGYNFEINYKKKWNNEATFFINHAFFLTQINKPIVGNVNADGNLFFANATKSIITKGFDTYIKLKLEDWELYAGCTYTIAERKYLTDSQFIPLTPKFRMAYMLTKEWEGKARFCVEASYNGKQYREDYTKTPGYFFMAAMIEYKFTKHVGLVINCENILDYRQSKVESIYTGTITNPIFKSLWAPTDGRCFNACLKFTL